MIVPGTLAVTGSTNTGALTASSVSTPALTVAGTPVYPQVNADWNAISEFEQTDGHTPVPDVSSDQPVACIRHCWHQRCDIERRVSILDRLYQLLRLDNRGGHYQLVCERNQRQLQQYVLQCSKYYEVLPTATWVTRSLLVHTHGTLSMLQVLVPGKAALLPTSA